MAQTRITDLEYAVRIHDGDDIELLIAKTEGRVYVINGYSSSGAGINTVSATSEYITARKELEELLAKKGIAGEQVSDVVTKFFS